jgi:hypothetical protein
MTRPRRASVAKPQPKRTSGFTAETSREKKSIFRENQQVQVFDFVDVKFAILMVFEFFLMTTEFDKSQHERIRHSRAS